jgi:hypothetical protein
VAAERDERELSLQLALGGSLIAARGYAHPETATAYERAAALGAVVGDAVPLGLARLGMSICYRNRGEVERGRALAAEVLAEAGADREQASLGIRTSRSPSMPRGSSPPRSRTASGRSLSTIQGSKIDSFAGSAKIRASGH